LTPFIVSHPHAAAVASETAAALAAADQLAAYFTGVAAAPGSLGERVLDAAARIRPQVRNRVVADVSPGALRSMWWVELTARARARVGGAGAYDRLFTSHDAAVAARRWPNAGRAVYAYEDAAERTFEVAAKRGLGRIWDLPLPHWVSLERMWIEEAARWPGAMGARPPIEPEWKKARKDRELALADVVSVASRFTRESLEATGCTKKIVQMPYGFPTELFRQRVEAPSGSFTVLAVGTHDLRKGTPYLLEAWRRLGLKDARLRLVGPMRLSDPFLDSYRGLFEHVAHVPRRVLQREYWEADLVAFPTLGDGFGLVMQEAMSCGVPVLTTRCGGGPECITSGVDGWIVAERSVDALADTLGWARSHRDEVWEIGIRARRRAERYAIPEARRTIAAHLGVL
jgi:glycosyltransferase involved in cell wall biosynthesis